MTIREAIALAQSRGWNPWRWMYNIERRLPEIHHPLDHLTENEVESILPHNEDVERIVRNEVLDY